MTSVLCETKKVKGLRREIHLPLVYVFFMVDNNSAEESRLCTSPSSRKPTLYY